MAYDDIDFSKYDNAYNSEPSYHEGQRSYFGDVIHNLWAGTGETLDLAGRGIETFTDGDYGSSLRTAGEYISETELAKSDIDTYLGEDSRFNRVITGVARAIPGVAAVAGAGVLGSATAGPVGGLTAAGTTMGTIFGGGTYSTAIDDGAKQGLEGDDLKQYALEVATWELASEVIGQGAGALTFGIFKAPTKAALKTLMSTGKVSSKEVLEELVKKEGGKTIALKLLGPPVLDGGSEVLNELGQNYAGTRRGLEDSQGDLWDVFLIGATMGGATATAGTIYSQVEQKQVREQLTAGLSSQDPGQSLETATQIYNSIKEVDPQLAEDFQVYYDGGGRDMSVSLQDISAEVKESRVKAEEAIARKSFLETEYQNYDPSIPEKILDGQTTQEVLKDEVDASIASRIATGIKDREMLRQKAPGATPEALTGQPLTQEYTSDQVRATEKYAPELPQAGQTARITAGVNQLNQRSTEKREQGISVGPIEEHYQAMLNKTKYPADRQPLIAEATKIAPSIKAEKLENALDSNPDGAQVILASLMSIKDKQESLANGEVTNLKKREEVRKEIKAETKILKEEVEVSKVSIAEEAIEPGLTKEGTYISDTDKLNEEELSLVSEAMSNDIDIDIAMSQAKNFPGSKEEFIAVLKEAQITKEAERKGENIVNTYPSGYRIVKVTNDKYYVLKDGEVGAQFTSSSQKGGALSAARAAAISGDLTTGTNIDQVGRKTRAEAQAAKPRRTISPKEMKEAEQFLQDNNYVKEGKDGIVEITSVEVGLALMNLMQAGKKLSVDNINEEIAKEVSAQGKGTEYARSTKAGSAPVYGSVGQAKGVNQLDLVEEVNRDDEQVEGEDKVTTADAIATAPTKPKTLRFQQTKNEEGNYTGVYESEWKGSNYSIKTEAGSTNLYEGDQLTGTFDNVQEAAESLGAVVKDTLGGKSEQQEVVKAIPEAERELAGERTAIDKARAETKKKAAKAPKIIKRKKGTPKKIKGYTEQQLRDVTVTSQVNFKGDIVEVNESAYDAIEYLDDKQSKLEKLLDCTKG